MLLSLIGFEFISCKKFNFMDFTIIFLLKHLATDKQTYLLETFVYLIKMTLFLAANFKLMIGTVHFILQVRFVSK